MSNKKLIIIASLLAFCLCLPQKKSCGQPAFAADLADYVKCLKTLTGAQPYGKRSVSPPSPFLQKLQAFLKNYENDDYSDDILYRVLKSQRQRRE